MGVPTVTMFRRALVGILPRAAGAYPVRMRSAHGGVLPPPSLGRWFTSWQLEPGVLIPLLLVLALYLWGVLRVARRHPNRPWPKTRTGLFVAGLAVVGYSTMAILGVYDDALFWMHMVQHLALIMVAPALLVGGRPIILAMHASRNPLHGWIRRVVRSRIVTAITCPPIAAALYAVVIVATHLTGLMTVVMTHRWAHDGEHLLYLVAGYLYFLPIVGDEPIRWRPSHAARLMLVLFTMPVDTFTGIALMTTNRPTAGMDHMQPRSWGPSMLSDLHTGGAVMWVVGDGLMLVLILVAFAAWAREGDSRGRSGLGWMERAREQTLAARTAAPSAAVATGRRLPSADDDDALAAYNAWLGRLAGRDDQPNRRDIRR
ncbi:MAG: hypothetical protein DLM56_11710 [Pseudonocardiales bacterium]|nr:MAG: hypothetical protein DLM56_11710 [Pseudonocardiales bacterium]